MKPFEFRTKALKQIEAAKTLLDTSPEIAWYTAGYAIEFMLKARLCVARDWTQFPSSFQQLEEWNTKAGITTKEKIFIHDLDKLLTISDSLQIKTSSYLKIDWNSACTWNEQVRYKPNDSISRNEATAYINEIELAVKQLYILELINSCLKIEEKLTAKYGLFHCFAIVENKTGWCVIASWIAKNEEDLNKREKELLDMLDNKIDNDLQKMITGKHFLPCYHPLLQGLYQLLRFTGGIRHSPSSVVSNNTVFGYPQFPPGYIITAGNWSEEDIKRSWAST